MGMLSDSQFSATGLDLAGVLKFARLVLVIAAICATLAFRPAVHAGELANVTGLQRLPFSHTHGNGAYCSFLGGHHLRIFATPQVGKGGWCLVIPNRTLHSPMNPFAYRNNYSPPVSS